MSKPDEKDKKADLEVEDLPGLCRWVIRGAESCFQTDKFVKPCVFGRLEPPKGLETMGEAYVCMPVEFTNVEDKNQVARAIVALVIAGAKEIAFVTEAWTVSSATKDKEGLELMKRMASGQGLSEHPDREEEVLLQYEAMGRTIFGKRKILRPAGEEPQLDPEGWKLIEPTSMSGRFCNTFMKAAYAHREGN